MTDPTTTVTLATTSTVPATPAEPALLEGKVWWKQKRTWSAIVALIGVAMALRFISHMAWVDVLTDDRVLGLVGSALAAVGISASWLSTFKGAKRTVGSVAAETASKPAAVPAAPTVTATIASTVTAPSQADEVVSLLQKLGDAVTAPKDPQ